jgi:hypothetical protein
MVGDPLAPLLDIVLKSIIEEVKLDLLLIPAIHLQYHALFLSFKGINPTTCTDIVEILDETE